MTVIYYDVLDEVKRILAEADANMRLIKKIIVTSREMDNLVRQAPLVLLTDENRCIYRHACIYGIDVEEE